MFGLFSPLSASNSSSLSQCSSIGHEYEYLLKRRLEERKLAYLGKIVS